MLKMAWCDRLMSAAYDPRGIKRPSRRSRRRRRMRRKRRRRE